jgi:predicted HD superfamily hydrolase involved in NAD metabolism
MEKEAFKKIKKTLKKKLDKERYQHTLGVASTAVCLAMRYEVDLETARLAGMLHDCAKCIPDTKKYQLCDQYGLTLSASEQENPSLLHAKLGPYIARDRYNIDQQEILDAITWHTTGKADMTVLEKIIFIADYIEPGRTKQANLAQIRKMAFIDLDETMYLITRDTLDYLSSTPGAIDQNTQAAYDYYAALHHQKMEDEL